MIALYTRFRRIFLSGKSGESDQVQVEQESGQVCAYTRPTTCPATNFLVIVNRHCHPAVTTGTVPTINTMVFPFTLPLPAPLAGILQITQTIPVFYPGSSDRIIGANEEGDLSEEARNDFLPVREREREIGEVCILVKIIPDECGCRSTN